MSPSASQPVALDRVSYQMLLLPFPGTEPWAEPDLDLVLSL